MSLVAGGYFSTNSSLPRGREKAEKNTTGADVMARPLVAADHVGEGRFFRGRRGGRRGAGSGDVGFRSAGVGQRGAVVEPGQEQALEEASRVQAPEEILTYLFFINGFV